MLGVGSGSFLLRPRKMEPMALRLGSRLGSTEKLLAGTHYRRQLIVDGALRQGFALRIRAPRRMEPFKRGALLSEGLLTLLARTQGIMGLRKRTKDYIYGMGFPLK